jgi:hypothetical protein
VEGHRRREIISGYSEVRTSVRRGLIANTDAKETYNIRKRDLLIRGIPEHGIGETLHGAKDHEQVSFAKTQRRPRI